MGRRHPVMASGCNCYRETPDVIHINMHGLRLWQQRLVWSIMIWVSLLMEEAEIAIERLPYIINIDMDGLRLWRQRRRLVLSRMIWVSLLMGRG